MEVIGRTKSTVLLLCRNVFKSLSEANMKLQRPNESNQVDIFQRYSLFSAKVPLFVTILPPAAQQGNTKREFDAKKTVNVSDIHLI